MYSCSLLLLFASDRKYFEIDNLLTSLLVKITEWWWRIKIIII